MASNLCKRAEVWLPLLAAGTFLPSVGGAFVYDDVRLIVENAFIRSPELWARAFTTHFWDVSNAPAGTELLRLYRPLVTLSYLGNWLVGSGQAWAFHLTNVLLHALDTWLVLMVALRLTKSRPLAVLSALAFALHPTRSEAVAWISGRPDVLMTAFVLLTLQFVHWGRRPGSRPLATLAVVLSFSGALLSKEPALATPLLLLASGWHGPQSERRWHLSMVALTASLGAGYLLLRTWLLPVGSPSLVWTPAHSLVTVGTYAERALFPWPLTFFHQLEQLTSAGPKYSPWDVGLGAVLVLGTLTWGALTWHRDRATFWLLLAGFAFLGPLLNVTQTGARVATSDRYLYLPLWLFFVAGCRTLSGPFARVAKNRLGRLILGGLFTVYALANVTRTFDFLSERSFWRSELSVNPDNPVALRALAVQQGLEGDASGARRNLAHSLELRALRYGRIVTANENAEAYGRLVALDAGTMPDGSVAALGLLMQDALDRLGGKARQTRSETLPIDWPADDQAVRWVALHAEETLARHLVPLATRLDVHDISLSLLDAIADERLHLAPSPLAIALGEAREQRFARAQGRIGVMRQRQQLMPAAVTEAALVDLEARIIAARDLFAFGEAHTVDERRLARARAFATLGAFLRALLEVQQVDPRHPGMRPLYVQLLVSARLEQTALQVASQALGSERAAATIDAIRSQLPPELRALSPVELRAAVVKSPTL